MLAGLIFGTALPAAAAEPTGQIYQQRAADGRIILTDRPSSSAVTERTWQVDREDKQAAQQRADDVRREADAVSERVQRRIDAQERLAAAEQERAMQAQREQQLARADEGLYYPGYGVTGPFPNRGFRFKNTQPPFFEVGTHKNDLGNAPKRPTHLPAPRPPRVSESAMP